MCLIVVQKVGDVSLSKKLMRQAWEGNPDGAGYMFCTEEQLIIRKPFWRAGDLRKAYREDHLRYGKYSPFVIHWRVATHGEISEANTHPHVVGIEGRVGVAHNGIILITPPKNMSDTAWYLFCRTSGSLESEIMDPNELDKIEKEVEGNNKLVFFSWDFGLTILNEKAGFWEGGRWYSNDHFRYSSILARPDSLQGDAFEGKDHFDKENQ